MTRTEREIHINYLESFLNGLSLKCLVKLETDCTVLLRVDNTSVIAYVNKMGGIQHRSSRISRRDMSMRQSGKIYLFASYIESVIVAAHEPKIGGSQ